MTAPLKPWESSASIIGNSIGSSGLAMNSRSNVLNSSAPSLPVQPAGSVRTTALPPLPPRPPQLSVSTMNRSPYGMNGMYGGGYSGYGGYGGYSSYGGYPGSSMYGGYMGGGYGYGSYGQTGSMFENRFLQAAEENSRGAFQSVESLVRAFSSVSMMLESTYHAMYSSFRAVLGVVDNFSRLRLMFSQFLSAITILKIIKSFYRRLLYWLGIINQNPVADQIWETATTGTSVTSKHSSWPLFTFIGLLFGGPYLVSKFFSSDSVEPKKWDLKSGTYYRAAFPYEAASDSELGFSENELINVAPAEMQLQNNSGWMLATNRQGKVGYVPVTRLGGQRRTPNNQTNYSNKPSTDMIPEIFEQPELSTTESMEK